MLSRCGGFSMFSLKSGSAISTNNARLCPLMLLALILIGVVLLSTSSLASRTETAHIRPENTSWESWATNHFFPPYHLYFCLCVAFSVAKHSWNFSPRTNCGMPLSVMHIIKLCFLFVRRSHTSGEVWKQKRQKKKRLSNTKFFLLHHFKPSALPQHEACMFSCVLKGAQKPHLQNQQEIWLTICFSMSGAKHAR